MATHDVGGGCLGPAARRATGFCGRRGDVFADGGRAGLAARNDWPVLTRILDKALAAIPLADRQAMQSHWIRAEEEPPSFLGIPRRPLPKFVGLALLLVLLLIGWNYELAKKVARRTRRLKEELEGKQAVEDVLRQREEQLIQIINLVPHMIFAKDAQGRFLLANAAMADWYGRTPEE
jgi:PAS domain-containing protein